jgi:predicted transposase/invertase (TIGR01784 family)
LDIPKDEYDKLTIINPFLKKDSQDDKYGILDVKLHTKSGSVVHIEIQLIVLTNLRSRIVYSSSKLITEQISSGEDWGIIKRTISIVITEQVFIHEGDKYHHQFRYRTNDGMELTDLVEINTLDLSKLPDDDNTDLWYWMRFIKSEDEEEIEALAKRSPQMKKAVGVLKELSADEQTRMLYESRFMAEIDVNSRVSDERKKWQKVVAEKDTEIADIKADKDAEIADIRAVKDTEIADIKAAKDAEIAKLKAQLKV